MTGSQSAGAFKDPHRAPSASIMHVTPPCLQVAIRFSASGRERPSHFWRVVSVGLVTRVTTPSENTSPQRFMKSENSRWLKAPNPSLYPIFVVVVRQTGLGSASAKANIRLLLPPAPTIATMSPFSTRSASVIFKAILPFRLNEQLLQPPRQFSVLCRISGNKLLDLQKDQCPLP